MIMGAFIFFIVIVAAVVIIGGWVAVSVGRGLTRLFFGSSASTTARQVNAARGNAYCIRSECHADNPAHAQFCRRCGEPLSGGSQRGIRIVA